MSKTKFSGSRPDRPSTIITSAFMNSIFQTDGGHKHDGTDADGHCAKIIPVNEINAVKGAPLDGYVLTVQDDQTCNWEALPDPVFMTVYPNIESVSGTLQNGISWSGTTLSVNSGIFTLMGTQRYDINPDYQKDFTLSASKTYHLRFSRYGYRNTQEWKSIAPSGVDENSFYLGDIADTTAVTGYNKYELDKDHAYFDSKYDDMLVAEIVTNSSANVSDYTFYVNRRDGYYKQVNIAEANLGRDGEYNYFRMDKFTKVARSFICNIDFWATMRCIGRNKMEATLRYYYPDDSTVNFLTIRGESTEDYQTGEHRSTAFTVSASGIFQVGRNSELDVYAKAYGEVPGQLYRIIEGGISVAEVGHSLPYISDHILYDELYTGTYGFRPKRPWFEL